MALDHQRFDLGLLIHRDVMISTAHPGLFSWRALARITYCLVLLALFLCGAEITSRVVDVVLFGTPFLASPDHNRDLIVRGPGGNRGKPHGRYKKWKLNSFGFRGPEITPAPNPELPRVVVLGASEAFGLYERIDCEFPARLRARLNSCEVINAAITGMTLRSMHDYWKSWVDSFRPDIVVIYANPLFYLADSIPNPTSDSAAAVCNDSDSARFESRFLDHVFDFVEVPTFLQKWRNSRALSLRLQGKPPNWVFDKVPRDRLDAFTDDLTRLTEQIQRSGGIVILVTHAMRAAAPLDSEELEHLEAARTHTPRASAAVIAEFESATRAAVISVADATDAIVVDAGTAISGNRGYFGDLVHFTDEGAEALAQILENPVGDAVATVVRRRSVTGN